MGMQHHMGFVQQGSNNPTVTEDTATAHSCHEYCTASTTGRIMRNTHHSQATAAAALKG